MATDNPSYETLLRSQMWSDRLRMSPEEFDSRMKDLYRTRNERLNALRAESHRANVIHLWIAIALAAVFIFGAWKAIRLFPGVVVPSQIPGRFILWGIASLVALSYLVTVALNWSFKWRGITQGDEEAIAVIRRLYPAVDLQDNPPAEGTHS